jgi:hypothetical protein
MIIEIKSGANERQKRDEYEQNREFDATHHNTHPSQSVNYNTTPTGNNKETEQIAEDEKRRNNNFTHPSVVGSSSP